MRLGFLDIQKFPKLDIYKVVDKPGSRIEYSIKLTEELRSIGKHFSNLPLKFASLIKASPSKEHQEFHADSEEGERAIIYLTDVEVNSNGPIEFKEYGKILGKSGTFVHYSANEIHRGCASDINRYALAFAFDESSKTITTIGASASCENYTCPEGSLPRDPAPTAPPYTEETCCVTKTNNLTWLWILLAFVPVLMYYFFSQSSASVV